MVRTDTSSSSARSGAVHRPRVCSSRRMASRRSDRMARASSQKPDVGCQVPSRIVVAVPPGTPKEHVVSATSPIVTLHTVDPQTLLDTYAVVLDAAVDVVAGITPDQATDRTPCDDFDVAALVGHTKGAVRRGFDLASGVDAFAG